MTTLPGQEPVQKPHPARHAFSFVGIVLWVALILGGFFAAAYYVSSVLTGGGMAAVISSVLVDLTNEDRAEENLGALTINPLLTAAAQAKADDMAARGYFAHATPEGLQPWHFIQEAGYTYASAGENLAVNFSDSENVEQAWMDSPKHRDNILSAKFTEIGIATAEGEYKGRKTIFVVQMFGSPRVVAAAPAYVAPAQTVTPENPEDMAIAVAPSEPEILGSEEEAVVPPSSTVITESGEPMSAPVYAAPVERLLASPENLLRVIFIVCGIIVLVALALTTRLEFRRHHFRHVVAAASLLLLMGGTLTLADAVIFTPPVLAEASSVAP